MDKLSRFRSRLRWREAEKAAPLSGFPERNSSRKPGLRSGSELDLTRAEGLGALCRQRPTPPIDGGLLEPSSGAESGRREALRSPRKFRLAVVKLFAAEQRPMGQVRVRGPILNLFILVTPRR